MRELIIGTRASDLALAQATELQGRLKSEAGVASTLRKFKTEGDKNLDVDLSHAGFAAGRLDKGMFTRDLEVALLDGEIDLAVHSLKDLPTKLPEGLIPGAILPREDVQDVLISRGRAPIDFSNGDLVVATGSQRRRCQLGEIFPGIGTTGLRGNVPTRMGKLLEAGDAFGAIVLAAAGLHRLGIPTARGCHVYREQEIWMEPMGKRMLHAVGQAAIAVECRAGEKDLESALAAINHPETASAVFAERALLSKLGGGCQMPLGVWTVVSGETMEMEAELFPADGGMPARAQWSGSRNAPELLAANMATQLESARKSYD